MTFCICSLITLIGSTNAELPNVSTIKALDIYFGICFLFVFGGLFEFATVVYLAMLEKQEKAEIKAKQDKAQVIARKLCNQWSIFRDLLNNLSPRKEDLLSTLADVVILRFFCGRVWVISACRGRISETFLPNITSRAFGWDYCFQARDSCPSLSRR